jgi:hypothetical protein
VDEDTLTSVLGVGQLLSGLALLVFRPKLITLMNVGVGRQYRTANRDHALSSVIVVVGVIMTAVGVLLLFPRISALVGG